MKVSWRPKAADDFERMVADASERGANAASRDKAEVERGILQMERVKDGGRKTRREGVRELAVLGTPYIVVSRRIGDEVLILRLFRTAGPTFA